MTIVLQHKFWGLKIYEDYFEVGLTFNQIPSTLVIPFKAIVGFVDPSVEFALHFEYETDEFEDKLDDDINNETPELSNTDEKDSSKAQDGNTESAPETKEETA